MALETLQDVRNRLDEVAASVLKGDISTNVAETARKVLNTAADTFRHEQSTALAPTAPVTAPAVSGTPPGGGATFNITFATTPHGPVFVEAPTPAEPAHPEPAPRPRPSPPQILDIAPTPPPATPPPERPPTRQASERKQATAHLLARYRKST
jgi:hypothetical protein